MSNTSAVSPYETGIGSAVVGICAGALAWLGEETAEDRAVIERLKDERHREATGGLDQQRLVSVNLHLKSSDSLIKSAEGLGYSQERPRTMNEHDRLTAPILLVARDGGRIAIESDAAGGLKVHTCGGLNRLQDLVRASVVNLAAEHLARLGGEVRRSRLSNGDIQLKATPKVGDLETTLTVEVTKTGELSVDVDGVHGPECQHLADDVANAVGGTVTARNYKTAYFNRPGESTKRRVKI